MEFRTAAVVSSWLTVAIISAVYMLVFGSSVGDILFGVFLPVGALVFAAFIITIILANSKPSQ
jgi:hypothetical protein